MGDYVLSNKEIAYFSLLTCKQYFFYMQATWGAILFCEMYRGDPNDLLNQLLCNKYDGFIVNVLKK